MIANILLLLDDVDEENDMDDDVEAERTGRRKVLPEIIADTATKNSRAYFDILCQSVYSLPIFRLKKLFINQS